MPLPLLIPLAVAGATAVGSYLAVRQVRQPLRVMILGHSGSGKTTLIRHWRGQWAPGADPTHDPEKISTIVLNTGRKVLNVEKKFILRKVTDFSGKDEALHTVRDEVGAATAVVYLVDATHLFLQENRTSAYGQTDAWVRILFDGNRLHRHLSDTDRVVVAVTHTAQDPRVRRLGAGYQGRIAEQLAPMTESIGNPNRIRLVAGSLGSADAAAELSDRIIAGLL